MLEEVKELVGELGYEYSESSGCFDIIAKGSEMNMVLIKAVGNIDSSRCRSL
jgi:predicted transcriptional regulator